MPKIYGAEPHQSEMTDLEPARYFNLAIVQINEAEQWMRTASEASQPLLLHLDIFIYLSVKYPDMARRRMEKLNALQIRQTFEQWFARAGKKIPAQFREGIRVSGERLLDALDRLSAEAMD